MIERPGRSCMISRSGRFTSFMTNQCQHRRDLLPSNLLGDGNVYTETSGRTTGGNAELRRGLWTGMCALASRSVHSTRAVDHRSDTPNQRPSSASELENFIGGWQRCPRKESPMSKIGRNCAPSQARFGIILACIGMLLALSPMNAAAAERTRSVIGTGIGQSTGTDVPGSSEESLGCMIEPWECSLPPVPGCEDGDGDLLGEHPVDPSCDDLAGDSGSAQPALDPDPSSSATSTSSPSGSLYESSTYEKSAEQQITADKRRRAALTRCRKLGGKARARCRTHASQIGKNRH